LVSIIVLTYNRFDLLSQTLTSILKQIYTDFEIVIVNDGSTDETKNLSKHFSDSRIRLFNLEKQNNLAKLRNFGIKQSRGEFISFCDDDDLWIDTKLEIQIPMMNEYDFICTNARLIDGDNKIVSEKYLNFDSSFMIFTKTLLLQNIVMPSSVIFKKEILKDDKPFDEKNFINLCEDYNLWINLSCISKKMFFFNENLILHRVHNSWARSFKHSQQIYLNHIELMKPFLNNDEKKLSEAAYLGILNNRYYKLKNQIDNKEYLNAFSDLFKFVSMFLNPNYIKALYLRKSK